MVNSKWMALGVVFWVCTVAMTAAGEQSLKSNPAAKAHFEAGLTNLDDPEGPRYEEAYREFHAAYAAMPSYKIANNIGYCAFMLERDAEALEMYELYLSKVSEHDMPRAKRAQLEKDVQSLRAGLVHIALTITPSNALVVDERYTNKGTLVVNRYPFEVIQAKGLGIHPGSHKITISADGYVSQTWSIDAQPGSSHAHEFKLESVASQSAAAEAAKLNSDKKPTDIQPPPSTTDQKRPVPLGVYIGAAATAVFAVTTGVTGVVALSKKSQLSDANNGTQYAKADSLRSDMRTFAIISDVSLGVTLISAGVTTYLYVVGRRTPVEHQTPTQTSWTLLPAFDVTGARLDASRRF